MGRVVSADEASSENIIYRQDFEDISVGAVPSEVVIAGNSSQQVVDTTSAEENRSYRMRGSYGGCWRALARISIELEDEMTLKGYYKLGDGREGCHNDRGHVSFRTVASSSWSEGSGVHLLTFEPDNTVTSNGTEVGEFNQYEWVKFEIQYIRDQEDDRVTHRCKINDGDFVSTTRDERSHEDDLSALELTSDDFTVFWDGIILTNEVDTLNESLPAQNGLAINDGDAYATSAKRDGDIQQINLDERTIINTFDAPSGSRAVGLAYGDGSLWFADGVEPDYDGEILELDPETGDVRSRINTSYDPTGLAFGENSLWVIDITLNDIEEYSPDGTRVGGFDISGPTDVTYGRGLAYFDGSLWVGEFAGSDGSSTASLYEFTTDGEFLQETGERTFPDGEGGGYGGLATTETELYGPDENGELSVLRTLASEAPDNGGESADLDAQFEVILPDQEDDEEADQIVIDDSIEFDASASSASEGAISSYEFDIDADGEFEIESTDPTATHTFSTIGSKSVTLRITDENGQTATTTESLTVHLKQYFDTLETAAALDDASTLSLVNAALPEELALDGAETQSQTTLDQLEKAVIEDELDQATAQEATQRLNLGQDELLYTAQIIGPAEKDLQPYYNLAFRIVKQAIDTVISVVVSIETSKLKLDDITEGLIGDFFTGWVRDLIDELQSGTEKLLGLLLGDGETKQTAVQELTTEVVNIGERILDGDISTTADLEDEISTAADTVVEIITAGPRAFVEFSAVAETLALAKTNPISQQALLSGGATYQLVSELNEALRPSNLTEGLSGSISNAAQTAANYVQTVENTVDTVTEFLGNLSWAVSELSIYGTLTDLEDSVENSDFSLKDLGTALLALLNAFLAGPVTAVVSAVGASTGFGTLTYLKLQQQGLIQAVVAGEEVTFDGI